MQYLSLVLWITLCLGVGMIGALWTSPAIPTWYAQLQKPWFSPPSWVFGPVWTLLYIMMAVAAWLVSREGGWRQASPALAMFVLQLALNFAWSGLFFGLRSPGAALVDIVLLWIAIVATIALFLPHSHVAAALLVPYLLWVSFATVLNYSFWQLNSPSQGVAASP